MTLPLLTFYNYIMNNDTFYTHLYKLYLPDCIDILPEQVCSSRKIRQILGNRLDQYFKSMIFRDCFLEYFACKLTGEFLNP